MQVSPMRLWRPAQLHLHYDRYRWQRVVTIKHLIWDTFKELLARPTQPLLQSGNRFFCG
jgi:hypothetical protein